METAAPAAAAGRQSRGQKGPLSVPLSSVDPSEGKRLGSGLAELDRVLGGGIMKRSAVLLGGDRLG